MPGNNLTDFFALQERAAAVQFQRKAVSRLTWVMG